MKKYVTILITAHNEQDVLSKLLKRLNKLAENEKRVDFEFLFVNDGSRDKTLPTLHNLAKKDRRISIISLSRNFGKELAMKAGLDNADGDGVVIIDADLQDPPELVPQMIKYWLAGYDDVYARRTSRRGESWLKKFTSNRYYRVLQSTTKIPVQRDAGDFRLLDRRCVLALRAIGEYNRNTKALFSWIGYRKKEITYERDKRAAGKTHWNYFQLVNLAIDGITSFTTAPLRLASILGVLVSLAAFVYIAVIVARTLVLGIDVDGYASTMSVVLFLGGVQLLSLGVIGEYVGRIFNESKNRPLYLIEEIHRGKTAKTRR
jgi:glycosyltransferase involved in cell wall biosynthesis